MREMKHEPLEAGRQRTLRGRDEICAHARDLLQRHGLWHTRQISAEREAGGRDGLPGLRVIGSQVSIPLPGAARARLTPGVSDLNAGYRALCLDEAGDGPPRGGLCVVPQARATRRDPALGRDRRGLRDDQPRAPDGTSAQMDQVPVARQAIHGRVLAHR
jgi:hypothetical protein